MEVQNRVKKQHDADLENQNAAPDPGLQSERTIDDIYREELQLKVKCVFAYLILMLTRVLLTVLQKRSVMDYYEYVTCASLMFGILFVYKLYTIGGLTNKNVVFLNSFIPITIVTSAIWHMANMEAGHFESQEAWAFC